MHFTVVFNSHESHDLSYGLVFTPCPVWMKGNKELINLHPDNPHYKPGDLQALLDKEDLNRLFAEDSKSAAIIIHSTGHGTRQYLANLRADLEGAGFSVQELSF